MMRNREIWMLALFSLVVSAAGIGAVWAVSPLAAAVCAGAFALLLAGYGAFTAWRYRQLRRLTEYLAAVYAGGPVLDIRDNTEGELSILKNDLYKITVTLSQQAEQLTRDKTFLADSLGDISHQMKTPLTSALMMADLLADPALPRPRREEFLRRLTEQLERMQWLIATLLKLSRLDAGAAVFQKQPVELRQLVEKAARPLEVAMELWGVEFVLHCPADARWTGDESWTVQAVQNILKNCLETMSGGGVLTAEVTSDPLGWQLTVTDTGGGIAPEDLPHIFQRFYKGKNAGENSAGIGLAFAKAVVEKQGGRIAACNRDKGACFTVLFPRLVV